MASDEQPGVPTTHGNNTHLSINFTDGPEQERVWGALSQGAKIEMPMNDTFWGARFGMLKDKYGINWMLNWAKHSA